MTKYPNVLFRDAIELEFGNKKVEQEPKHSKVRSSIVSAYRERILMTEIIAKTFQSIVIVLIIVWKRIGKTTNM